MKFQQIRSATVKITYAGRTFLVDPWLSSRYMSGSLAMIPMFCFLNKKGDHRKKYVFEECANWKPVNLKHKLLMCPSHSLPMSVMEVNEGVDAYICTHVHIDHIGLAPNGKACQKLNRNLPIYAINKQDADYLEYSGMKDVRVVEERFTCGDAEIIKVNAVHGTIKPCREAAGFIFRAPGEKTLYLCGDTIWCDDVKNTIEKYKAEVIITNNCAAMLKDNGRLIMDDNDLAEVVKAAPDAFIIASHMDNVPHATLTRKSLARKLKRKGILYRVHIPEDGETYSIAF
ncbi:MAG: MBL fold metallo-hydrolase [Clostridiales bacterium]|nr:MBL fold metallo-hydrolase [Candidatus Crickella merdequi]